MRILRSKKLLIHQRLSFYDTILFLLIFSMLFVGTRLNTFLIGITKMITSLVVVVIRLLKRFGL